MSAQSELVIGGFHRTCKNYPDNTAIIYLGERFSYKRLKELIDRFATALYDLGVRSNDKVVLYIPNCPQFLIGYFGKIKDLSLSCSGYCQKAIIKPFDKNDA